MINFHSRSNYWIHSRLPANTAIDFSVPLPTALPDISEQYYLALIVNGLIATLVRNKTEEIFSKNISLDNASMAYQVN